MSGARPETDIIVVTYNARVKLAACIRSVIRHTRRWPFRLTVVDNASSDGTAGFIKERFSRQCRLIRSGRNRGFSGGVNLAIRRTRLPWVVLLDDDAEVTPGWLAKLHALARKNPDIGIVGGKVVFPDNRIFSAEFRITPFSCAGSGEPDKGQRDYIRAVDALPGPCWLMPRRVIEKVGDFDERFFPCQCEDIDYCIRVRLAGYKIYYHGGVKIIHHNLFRREGSEDTHTNDKKFLKKWRGILDQFPLQSVTADEELIATGARILRNETFRLSQRVVLDRLIKTVCRFPESLFRGIAHWAAGRRREASFEFQKTLREDVYGSASKGWTTNLCRILSVYFKRLGMKSEAARCGRVVAKFAAATISFKNQFTRYRLAGAEPESFYLHRWQIQIRTDAPDYRVAMRSFLPHYWRQVAPTSKKARCLRVYFSSKKRCGHEGKHAFISPRVLPIHYPAFGVCRILDPKERSVSINMPRYASLSWMFHVGFLYPFSFLLRLNNASLVHGALLQKNTDGILIMGQKGVGKSTLSTVCLENGFRYFSDEHPIIELSDRGLRGRSFVSPIALPAISAGNFGEFLRTRMRWSEDRGKYLLDPMEIWPRSIGNVTRITKVIFPSFSPRGKLAVKSLSANLLFRRLIEDEYLKFLLPQERECSDGSIPRRIAALLSETARGYGVRYSPRDIFGMADLFEKL